MESERTAPVHENVNEKLFEAKLKENLLAVNAIKEMDFSRAKRVRGEQIEYESLVSLLVRLGMVSERAMAQALADVLSLKLCKPGDFPIEPVADDQVSSRFLHDQLILPVELSDGKLMLAMADPTQTFARQAIEMACEVKVEPCVAIKVDIQQALQRAIRDCAEHAQYAKAENYR